MRRLRKALKRTYYWRKCNREKDDEGNTYFTYNNPEEISAIIRHASGRADVAQYGEKLGYILKMQYEDGENIAVDDGVCVYVDKDSEPDYKVVDVKGLTDDAFKVYTLEVI